jgi:thioredoxin reductase (NADPH)
MTTEAALVRRFGPDYRIVTADSPSTGLSVLERLASDGEDVALIAADLQLPGMDGVAFLEQAQELHRDASRVLLLAMDRYHTRIPLTELAALQRATALGRIDFWVVKGWVTPEEWLYPQVQEALSTWTITHGPHHVVYRIVGEQMGTAKPRPAGAAEPKRRAVRLLPRGLPAGATVAPRLLS